MHSSLLTPTIGLAILSFTSARVIEKRETCWEDPAYLGLWGNPPIYDSVNQFCIGLLGMKGDDYCAANVTSVVVSREAITATSTLSTVTTVHSTITETITNTAINLNRREALAAVTNADFLEYGRSAIKRQAGANVGRGLQSACSCGNVAGSIQLSHTPKICTNTRTKIERGFATALIYTGTVTSGTVTVTVTEDKTLVITLSSATATSYAPVSLISDDTSTGSSITYPTSEQIEWNDHWFKFNHSKSRSKSTVVTSEKSTTRTTSTTTTAETTTTKTTGSATTTVSTEKVPLTWKDWVDYRHHTSKTRVMVDDILPHSSTSSVSKPTGVHNTMISGAWIDFNIMATSSSFQVQPPPASSATESSSVHLSTTTSEGWADWVTKASSTSSTWFTRIITSTTSSTACSGKETVYLGKLTTTVTQTVNVTQPASTVTIQPTQRRHRWYGW